MTFIVTAVCVAPKRHVQIDVPRLLVEPAVQDSSSPGRAGYLPGLTRYFGKPIEGVAFHLLLDEGDGYLSSNPFFEYPEDENEPARLLVPEQHRRAFERILSEFLSASGESRVVLVAEDNGHVTAPDLTEEEAKTIDRVGPIDLDTFWRLVDLGEIREDSVVVLEARELTSVSHVA